MSRIRPKFAGTSSESQSTSDSSSSSSSDGSLDRKKRKARKRPNVHGLLTQLRFQGDAFLDERSAELLTSSSSSSSLSSQSTSSTTVSEYSDAFIDHEEDALSDDGDSEGVADDHHTTPKKPNHHQQYCIDSDTGEVTIKLSVQKTPSFLQHLSSSTRKMQQQCGNKSLQATPQQHRLKSTSNDSDSDDVIVIKPKSVSSLKGNERIADNALKRQISTKFQLSSSSTSSSGSESVHLSGSSDDFDSRRRPKKKSQSAKKDTKLPPNSSSEDDFEIKSSKQHTAGGLQLDFAEDDDFEDGTSLALGHKSEWAANNARAHQTLLMRQKHARGVQAKRNQLITSNVFAQHQNKPQQMTLIEMQEIARFEKMQQQIQDCEEGVLQIAAIRSSTEGGAKSKPIALDGDSDQGFNSNQPTPLPQPQKRKDDPTTRHPSEATREEMTAVFKKAKRQSIYDEMDATPVHIQISSTSSGSSSSSSSDSASSSSPSSQSSTSSDDEAHVRMKAREIKPRRVGPQKTLFDFSCMQKKQKKDRR